MVDKEILTQGLWVGGGESQEDSGRHSSSQGVRDDVTVVTSQGRRTRGYLGCGKLRSGDVRKIMSASR